MGEMSGVNKTLYIPLCGKAMVSKKGIILKDPMAEMIWDKEGFCLKGKAKSKWLAYYMSMRTAVYDAWTKTQLEAHPDAVVLHLGCGMDSRCLRAGKNAKLLYDVDFPEVIKERMKYYPKSERYQMIGADVCEKEWIDNVPRAAEAIVIMEGISMYLPMRGLVELLGALRNHFGEMHLLMDAYTEFAVKASKVKNPIKEVGAVAITGIDYPEYLADQSGITYVREHSMTPARLIGQLSKSEQKVFKALYGGRMSRRLYRMYEYEQRFREWVHL